MNNNNQWDSRSRKRYYIIVAVLAVIVLIGKIREFSNAGGGSAADPWTGGYEETQTVTGAEGSGHAESQMPQESQESLQGSQEMASGSSEQSLEAEPEVTQESMQAAAVSDLKFRSKKLLNQHYEKHGIEMGFASAEEYEAAVVNHPDVLHKIEAEDGDDVYYVESTNEFVIVSTDGYLRTYFNPSGGIKYYNKQ